MYMCTYVCIHMYIYIYIYIIYIYIYIIFVVWEGGWAFPTQVRHSSLFLTRRMECPAWCSGGRRPLIEGCLSLRRLGMVLPVTRPVNIEPQTPASEV